MTPYRHLLLLLVAVGLILSVGGYFYRELGLIPSRITESDQTMLRTDKMRHIFKVSILNSRAHEAFIQYINSGDAEILAKSTALGMASLGFVNSGYLNKDERIRAIIRPLILRNIEIAESVASPEDAAAMLAEYGENIAAINRECEYLEQDNWVSFQRDFVEFQTSEKRAQIAYQFSAALACVILLIILFFFVRQRALLRLIEARERDLEKMIAMRNKELDLLRQTQAAAEAADRAKTEFLALMSHELRTPLNAIIGFSEIVKEGGAKWRLQDKTTEYAGAIHSASQHLLNVINDILDLAKIESGEARLHETDVDLREVVKEALTLVRRLAEKKRLAIAADCKSDLPMLRADNRLVLQILINLLSNAIKFTEPGGNVTVCARLESDGGIMLAVEDTGVGINEKDIALILQPFGQLRQNATVTHEGTGLGLPLTRSFAELHGATITIESESGVGTRVVIRFPAFRTLSATGVENLIGVA